MNSIHWIVPALFGAMLTALILLVPTRLRAPSSNSRKPRNAEGLDTVMAWTPEITRVMTAHECQAYRTVTRAMPDHMVLAQVPLARFIKVPKRHSYEEWLDRVGRLNADLLVCDRASGVLAVIEIHSPNESPRSLKRHERLARVLKAAGVRKIVWTEGKIPTVEAARELLSPAEASRGSAPTSPTKGTTPQAPAHTPIPVLEDADLGGDTQLMRDPTPSTWFDDFDSSPMPLASGKKH
jgi:hypothetical protein